MNVEYQNKTALLRIKAADGTLTLEDMREIIKILRQDRMAAGQTARATAAKRKKAHVEIPHADDMLADLEGL